MAKKKDVAFDPEKFMQLAITAMQNSIEEPRGDGKVSPKVGAVLIKADGTHEIASRGELRYGDHAEYTVLERKNRSNKLDGCILFTTLEPCAPGARKHPKLSCAERIVNARIKEVWIGIEDPDPAVDRKGIKFIEDHGVKVHMFYPEYQKQINSTNRAFLEQAIERAKEDDEQKEVMLSEIEKPITSFDSNQLSEKAIRFYLDKTNHRYKYDSEEMWSHFEKIGVVQRTMKGKASVYVPTGFGILLFGSNPRETYPQAVIKAKVKYGNNPSIPKDFEGPLVLMPSEIENWLEQVLHSEISRKKFERKTKTQFPIEPLREAIINALAHRDYDEKGAKTYIEIDDDKIVIKSPGLPVSPISLDDVMAFRAPSLSRNPTITFVFNKMHLMEEAELGMETFRGMQEKFNLPLPFYEYKAPYLSLTFSRSLDAIKSLPGKGEYAGLNSEEISGISWIKAKNQTRTIDYAEHFGFNEKKAQRHLAKFKANRLVQLKGRGSNAIYEYIGK